MVLADISQMMTAGVALAYRFAYCGMSESLKEWQLPKAVKQAAKLLEKQGITVS